MVCLVPSAKFNCRALCKNVKRLEKLQRSCTVSGSIVYFLIYSENLLGFYQSAWLFRSCDFIVFVLMLLEKTLHPPLFIHLKLFILLFIICIGIFIFCISHPFLMIGISGPYCFMFLCKGSDSILYIAKYSKTCISGVF